MFSDALGEDRVFYSGNFIVIPIKPRKRMVSLRLSEDDLATIEKFVIKHGACSRTLVLTKLIEAFAEGIRRSGYCVSSVKLEFVRKNGENSVSIVLNFNSSEK
jgi:hypothetical protein